MACTVSATRFSTPTLRINLATCALTVRSPMPSGVHFIEMASAERESEAIMPVIEQPGSKTP